MILTDRQIRQAIETRNIIINDFEERQIQPATYDLRIGGQGVTTSGKELVDIKKKGYLTLEPGDFAVIITLEKIEIGPQYAARFGLRSYFARKGIIATTGPQIDPGFRGRLIVGLTNLTPNPVAFSYKDDFLTVEFHKLEEPSESPYGGGYQDTESLRPEDIALVTEQKGMALSEMLNTLSSLSSNVATLAHEVQTIKWVFGIGLALLAVLIGYSTIK